MVKSPTKRNKIPTIENIKDSDVSSEMINFNERNLTKNSAIIKQAENYSQYRFEIYPKPGTNIGAEFWQNIQVSFEYQDQKEFVDIINNFAKTFIFECDYKSIPFCID